MKKIKLPLVILKSVFTALVTIIAVLTAIPASAQASDQFACDPGFYQVISGQLASFNPATGEYINIGQDYSNYNAIGYRIADGYIYGVAGKNLYRVDANGVRYDLGTLNVASGAYTGDFGDDGLLHISRGGRDWYKVNVDSLEAKPVPELSVYYAVADITNVHGKFYGVSSDGTLYIFDPVALTISDGGLVSNLPDQLKSYGAAWATAGGNLYVGRNSGEIYQITGYSTGSPVATLVGRATATNSNDGASCSLAVVAPGLNDVDGPESETKPSTPKAQAAAEDYVENYEKYSQTFTPVEEEPPTEEEQQPVTTSSESSPPIEDAGIGQGASCGPSENVDRAARFSVEDLVRVETETSLFASDFSNGDMSAFQLLSGNWSMENGKFNQLNTCGFDYTALLTTHVVDHFRWTATFNSINAANQGGVVFNQSSTQTRSGAILVDLAENGSVLRWGYYDNAGYYQSIGTLEVQAPAVGKSINLAVEVTGSKVKVILDDQISAEFETKSVGGMVGLVSSESDIAFDSVQLTALPS